MSDVIDDAAIGHVNISILGSAGSSSHSSGQDTNRSHLLEPDYSDDDFLVVECRVTPAGDLTASVTSEQLRRKGSAIDNRLQDSKGTNVVVSTANGSRATCTETADSLKS